MKRGKLLKRTGRAFGWMLLAACLSCSGGQTVQGERIFFNTLCRIQFQPSPRAIKDGAFGKSPEAFLEELFSELKAGFEAMDAVHDESPLNQRLRQGKARGEILLTGDVAELLSYGLQLAAESGGAFDPSIQPLTLLWAIGMGGTRVPDTAAIEAAKAQVGFERIRVEFSPLQPQLPSSLQPRLQPPLPPPAGAGNSLGSGAPSVPAEPAGLTEPEEPATGVAAARITRYPPGFALDFGAVGKGWAALRVQQRLIEAGVQSALIQIGGNVTAVGRHPSGRDWVVGVQDPQGQTGDFFCYLKIADTSVSTSGNYERYFEADGKRYHHILSRETGFPVETPLESVTVISRHALDTDGFSTVLYALPRDDAFRWVLNPDHECDALFLYADGSLWGSRGARERLFFLPGHERTVRPIEGEEGAAEREPAAD